LDEISVTKQTDAQDLEYEHRVAPDRHPILILSNVTLSPFYQQLHSNTVTGAYVVTSSDTYVNL